MKKLKYVAVIVFAILATIACNQKNKENQANDASPEMYKTSELAELMRNMYADNELIKEQIMNGQWPDSLPSYFVSLHTAEATDPSDINDTYKGLADVYLGKFEALKQAKPENRVTAYNDLVNGCVSCHQVFCNGPIPKIKKLLITP